MSLPFPGMDPYLEGDLWPDVHQALATQIRRLLMPLIQPAYVARISRYFVEDTHPESDMGVVYPDVSIIMGQSGRVAEESSIIYAGDKTPAPPVFSIPILAPVEVPIPVVEIRDTKDNRLITTIEILSPVNKRSPGMELYLQKRTRLHQSGVHLLEIDLLRRGTRPVQHPRLHKTAYLISLTRAGHAQTDVWPFDLHSAFPIIPVPLEAPDADVPLDLQQALSEVYADAAYHLSINYRDEPPPPKLPDDALIWVKALREPGS